VTQLSLPELKLPDNIESMMANGGYGEFSGEGAVDPKLQLHLEQLKGDVKVLGVLEFQLQTQFLRMQKRREGGGDEGGVRLDAMDLDSKHNSSGYKRVEEEEE